MALGGDEFGGDEGGLGGDEFGGEEGGADLGAPPADTDSDFDSDGFDATDAAVGGEEELGRGRR